MTVILRLTPEFLRLSGGLTAELLLLRGGLTGPMEFVRLTRLVVKVRKVFLAPFILIVRKKLRILVWEKSLKFTSTSDIVCLLNNVCV